MSEVKLGDLVRDRVTGFTGVAVCRSEWLNKCVRITIQPRELKDGKILESNCFDIEQIDIVDTAVMERKKESTGGPMPSAKEQGK